MPSQTPRRKYSYVPEHKHLWTGAKGNPTSCFPSARRRDLHRGKLKNGGCEFVRVRVKRYSYDIIIIAVVSRRALAGDTSGRIPGFSCNLAINLAEKKPSCLDSYDMVPISKRKKERKRKEKNEL